MTQEEMLIKLGLDPTGLNAGTVKALDAQKKAAMDYTSFWETAISKRESAEQAANIKSIERERARAAAVLRINAEMLEKQAAQKIASDKIWMEEYAAQVAISKGSIPANMTRNAEGHLVSDIEAGTAGAVGAVALGKAAKVAVRHGRQAGIIRESMVIIRESVREMWNRVAASASLLAQYIGLSATTLVTSIPIVGTAAAGLFANFRMSSSLDEQAGGYGSNEASQETIDIIRKRLEKEIGKLVAAGKLDDATGRLYGQQLGSMSGIKTTQRALAGLLPEGFDTELPTKKEEIKKADEAAARAQHDLDELNRKKEKGATLEKDIADRRHMINMTQATLNGLDKDSVDFHKLKADLIQQQVDLQKDLNQQQEQANQQKKEEEETDKKLAEWSKQAATSYMKNLIHGAQEESVYPTIEDLAGQRWMQRLKNFYDNPRGRGYLGAGNGPLAEDAREYELAKYQQSWDRTYGNMGDAEQDRLRMVNARTRLVEAGAASPEQLLGKIGDDTGKLRQLFYDLVYQGVIIKGTD